MPRFSKKPAFVRGHRFDPTDNPMFEVIRLEARPGEYTIKTHTGWANIQPGDWVLTSELNGENYPCSDVDSHAQFCAAPEPPEPPYFNYSEALIRLKQHHRLARKGWNGTGMFVYLVPATKVYVSVASPMGHIFPVGTQAKRVAYLEMFTAHGELVPWLASQTDMLMHDWYEVKS